MLSSDLGRRVETCGSCPGDLDTESALKELLGGTDHEYHMKAQHLASFNVDKIKVLHRNISPRPAAELMPDHALAYLRDFRFSIEKSERQADHDNRNLSITPYWDPKLRHSFKARLQLYKALWARGLLTFRHRTKSKVGFFCVKKKDGMQRLIVDARLPNACHHRPPTTRLATPACYSNLDLSASSHEANGFGGLACEGDRPWGAEGDVGDCFYNFVVEELASWFSLDEWKTAREWRELGFAIDSIFDDESSSRFDPDPDTLISPCFAGICMGWSWALYFANEIVNHQVLISNPELRSSVLRDRAPVPGIFPERPVTGVYIDNVQCVGGRMQDPITCTGKVSARFKSLGSPFDVCYPDLEEELSTLGLRFRFRQRSIVPKHRRSWRLYLALHGLRVRGRVRGEHLRVVLGHVINHFQIMRCSYSAISSSYKFVQHSLGHRCSLWPSVRRELRVLAGLVLVAEAPLDAQISPVVHVSDSSMFGYVLMSTKASIEHIRSEIRYKGSWRFVEQEIDDGPLLVPASEYDYSGGLSQLLGDDGEIETAQPHAYDIDYPGHDIRSVYHPIGDGRIRAGKPKAGVGSSTRYGLSLCSSAEVETRRAKPHDEVPPERVGK